MTGNEPGVPGENHHDTDVENTDFENTDVENSDVERSDVDDVGEPHRGSMIEAEEAAAQETSDDRSRRAEAGDSQARAELADLEKPNRVRQAAEWLDEKLIPRLGGAEVGPYDEESEDSVASHDACPLCGHPMGAHQIDRSHPNAVLICPAPQIPEMESFEPLNEVGMIKRRSGTE
ncbi:hypothetical protein ACX3O0_05230 [Homoserinimonas sp. A447]